MLKVNPYNSEQKAVALATLMLTDHKTSQQGDQFTLDELKAKHAKETQRKTQYLNWSLK